jgi:hypothetical protein
MASPLLPREFNPLRYASLSACSSGELSRSLGVYRRKATATQTSRAHFVDHRFFPSGFD